MPSGGRRRKSAYVGFSVISLSAAALAGCDQPVRDPEAQDARIYTSVADCEREQPARACEAGWSAAQVEQVADAPQFADRADCEARWGQGRCTQEASSFVPAIAGFMLLASFRGLQPRCGPGTSVGCDQGGAGSGGAAAANGWVVTGHPVYVGSGGRVFAGWQPVGETVKTSAGGLALPRTVTVVDTGGRVSPGITTRGGFGRAFGAFGEAGG